MSITFSKPDFLVVGPFRTGTTWLYSQLNDVPGVSMPPHKEISFFYNADRKKILLDMTRRLIAGTYREDLPPMKPDEEMKKQIWGDYVHNRKRGFELARKVAKPAWAWHYKWIPRNFSLFSIFLYTRLFNQSRSAITGDISPAYFGLSDEAVVTIMKFFPDIKIIFIIRDPVEREWSTIRLNYFSDPKNASFSAEKYFQKKTPDCDYKQSINTWEKHFDKDHILYLFYDDLVNTPQNFMDRFIQFVKPGTQTPQIETTKIGMGIEVEMDTGLRTQLLKKNLLQYDFLAEKFGAGYHPARWSEKALADLEKPF